VAAKGLSSSEVAIFLLNTPTVAWDPNADPNGRRRDIALKKHGDTRLGRWEVRAWLTDTQCCANTRHPINSKNAVAQRALHTNLT